MMKKKLATIVLATTMVASTVMPVFAAGEAAGTQGDFTNNTADTTVSVLKSTDAETNLSATVPLTVTLAVRLDGTVLGPANYELINTSRGTKIKVKEIMVTPSTNYIVTGTATGAQTDISTISLKPGTGVASTLGDLHTNNAVTDPAWTLEAAGGNDTCRIAFGGTLASIANIKGAAEQAFTLSYTIEKVNP